MPRRSFVLRMGLLGRRPFGSPCRRAPRSQITVLMVVGAMRAVTKTPDVRSLDRASLSPLCAIFPRLLPSLPLFFSTSYTETLVCACRSRLLVARRESNREEFERSGRVHDSLSLEVQALARKKVAYIVPGNGSPRSSRSSFKGCCTRSQSLVFYLFCESDAWN